MKSRQIPILLTAAVLTLLISSCGKIEDHPSLAPFKDMTQPGIYTGDSDSMTMEKNFDEYKMQFSVTLSGNTCSLKALDPDNGYFLSILSRSNDIAVGNTYDASISGSNVQVARTTIKIIKYENGKVWIENKSNKKGYIIPLSN